jgi:hypothetical protein
MALRVERGEAAEAAAKALIAESRASPLERQLAAREAREREDERNERESYAMWLGMSDGFKAQNPWRGKVFAEPDALKESVGSYG